MRRLLVLLLTLVVEAAVPSHQVFRNGDRLRLVLSAPEAHSVAFASSLDDFLPHAAVRVDRKRWELQVPAGKPFRYFYVVDGKPLVPPCPCRELDDYGGETCVYEPGM